jgi:hypothetical protein
MEAKASVLPQTLASLLNMRHTCGVHTKFGVCGEPAINWRDGGTVSSRGEKRDLRWYYCAEHWDALMKFNGEPPYIYSTPEGGYVCSD